jgi:NAD(P)-dependent dehydrogenase (short-subunit alcohol dehydrogenase family)
MAPLFDLSGRVALVTGAGQNVGAGIARSLSSQGAVVVVNDIRAERAEQVAKELDGIAAPFDVTDLEAVAAGVAAIGRPIDILVNNAGNGGAAGITIARFREMDPLAWEGPLRINIHGVLNCTKAVIDDMCDRGWGRIITISSTAGTAGVNIGVAPYSAGKGAGISFTRTLALEVAGTGVTCNTLALGLMTYPEDPSVTATLAQTIPVGRTGEPEDVGAACVWLASDEASWITAQTIELNGGWATT